MLNRRSLLGSVIGTVGLSQFRAVFDAKKSGWRMSWHAIFDDDLQVKEFWAPRVNVTPEQLSENSYDLVFETENMALTNPISIQGMTLWAPDGLPVSSIRYTQDFVTVVNDLVSVTYRINGIPSHRINDQQWIINTARDMLKSRTERLRKQWAETNHGA